MVVELTREELREAVAEGVRRAIADLFAGENVPELVARAIREGIGEGIDGEVREAISNSLPATPGSCGSWSSHWASTMRAPAGQAH